MARNRITVFRAAGWVVFVCLALACWQADTYLKRWPDNGLALDGEVVVSTEDWPAFWRAVLGTSTGEAVEGALRRPLDSAERAVRLAVGIRPTPMRWSIWLGPRAVLSRQGDQWLLCTRPGILLRLIWAADNTWRRYTGSSGQPTRIAWAWRDGYLLFSQFPVDQTAVAAVASSSVEPGAPSLLLRWATAHDGATCRVEAFEGLPFHLELSGPGLGPPPPLIEPTPPGLTAADADAMLYWTASATGRRLLESLPGVNVGLWPLPALEGILRQPLPQAAHESWFHAPRDWERCTLFSVDSDTSNEVLYTGRSVHRPAGVWPAHPLLMEILSPALSQIPYSWGPNEGFLLPVLGVDYTYGCAVQGAWAHVANPPENLGRLLRGEAIAAPEAPSLELVVHWRAMADPVGKVLRTKGWTEHLGVDPQAFDAVVQPWLDALTVLGSAQARSVNSTGNAWRIEGTLCAPWEHHS